jgi:hypothetical protein
VHGVLGGAVLGFAARSERERGGDEYPEGTSQFSSHEDGKRRARAADLQRYNKVQLSPAGDDCR